MSARQRRPQPGRYRDDKLPRTKAFTVIGASIYNDQRSWIDDLVKQLRAHGYRKANRSSVLQAMISCGQERFEGKDPEEIITYLADIQRQHDLAVTQALKLRRGA